MKVLDNKEFCFEGSVNTSTYKELIEICLKHPPEGGFVFEEMEKRLRIKKIVSESNGSMEFEDQDAYNLATITQNMKWGICDEKLLEFVNDVKQMKDVVKKPKLEKVK